MTIQQHESADVSEEERWLPVVGFEGLYEVSDLGRVRSLGRVDVLGRRWKPRPLRPTSDGEGYLKVGLTPRGPDGAGVPPVLERVGVLVLAAFVGPRPAGHDCCHKNHVPWEHGLSNLHWGPRSDNLLEARRNFRTGGLTRNRPRRGRVRIPGHCFRAHRLVAPNLTPPLPSRGGGERCLACCRGRNAVAYARRKYGLVLDLQVESDRHYALIMGSAA
jgi:hypothetical protein